MRCLARDLIPVQRVACILNAAQNSCTKGKMSLQFCQTYGNVPTPRICVQRKTAFLQKSHLFSKAKGRNLRLHLKRCIPIRAAVLQQTNDASPLQMRTASLKQHDPCVYRTCIQSFQFNNTLAQADNCLPLVQRTPTTNLEH